MCDFGSCKATIIDGKLQIFTSPDLRHHEHIKEDGLEGEWDACESMQFRPRISNGLFTPEINVQEAFDRVYPRGSKMQFIRDRAVFHLHKGELPSIIRLDLPGKWEIAQKIEFLSWVGKKIWRETRSGLWGDGIIVETNRGRLYARSDGVELGTLDSAWKYLDMCFANPSLDKMRQEIIDKLLAYLE
jgi:hypothetical protein